MKDRSASTTPWRPRRRPAGGAAPVADDGSALAVLTGWCRAAFRGYATVGRRGERTRIVAALAARLPDARVRVIAADDVAVQQWQNQLAGGASSLPKGWKVQTPQDALAAGGRFDDEIVIADTVELYLTNDFTAAVMGARAVLGLCTSPVWLGDGALLRKHLGQPLDLGSKDPNPDLGPLAVPRAPDPAVVDQDTGAREQLMTAADPGDALAYYLNESKKFPLLTAEDEILLSKQIEAGLAAEAALAGSDLLGRVSGSATDAELRELAEIGCDAKQRFIASNLRLVYSIARPYSGRMELMDLVQEGNLGLIRAVEKFDYRQGNKFSTYATWWIRQAITRAIADKAQMIRLPVHVHESDALILREVRRRQREQESIRPSDVAAALAEEEELVEEVLRRHRPPYSIEALQQAGLDIEDPFALAAEDYALSSLLGDRVDWTLQTLSEREAGVLRMRYGLVDGMPMTLEHVGKVYGVTRERIRQIEKAAMTKLRHPSSSQALLDYWE